MEKDGDLTASEAKRLRKNNRLRHATGDNLGPLLSQRAATSAPKTRGHLPLALRERAYTPYGLKAIPSRVVVEEDYVGILEAIIQRDFFPDLHRLRLEKAIAEAKSRGDVFVAKDLNEQLVAVKCLSAKALCVPRRVKLLDGKELNVRVADLSLGAFQSLFTSEDNCSFEQIVREEKKKLSQEQAWIEESAFSHNEQNQAISDALKRGERPAQLLYSNLDARNALMFPLNDGNVGTMEIHRNANQEFRALCLGKFARDEVPDPLKMPIGQTVLSNTRILSDAGAELLEELSTAKEEKLKAEGKRSEELSLFDAMIEHGVYSAVEVLKKKNNDLHPRMRAAGQASAKTLSKIVSVADNALSEKRYSFLRTPTWQPGVNVTPIMTWGKMAGTPLVLNEDSSNRFSIPEISAKDAAANRLSDNAAKKMQKSKARQGSCLREILCSPMADVKDLFGGPTKLSGLQLLRQHTLNKRTPRVDTTHAYHEANGGLKRARTAASETVDGAPNAADSLSITANLLNF